CPKHVPQKERCRNISTKPAVFTIEASIALLDGIHFNQAGSHSRLTSPIPMNTDRQPYITMSTPAPKVPTTFPHLRADMRTPLANPRWYSGRCAARIFEHDGNATDSPIPSIKRIASKAVNPYTMPVVAVASDQSR